MTGNGEPEALQSHERRGDVVSAQQWETAATQDSQKRGQDKSSDVQAEFEAERDWQPRGWQDEDQTSEKKKCLVYTCVIYFPQATCLLIINAAFHDTGWDRVSIYLNILDLLIL